jgi:acetyl-CoA carboxylase biotin carboxyl carrier protein
MNFEEIKELIKIFDESNISKIAIKNSEIEFSLEKNLATENIPVQVVQPQQPAVAVSQEIVEAKAEAKPSITLNSPMVGTFYSAPAPNAKPFINVGDTVSKGQTIGILEAMKIMNEWEADYNCKIVKMLVEDGQPVEYGTPIFEVEKL